MAKSQTSVATAGKKKKKSVMGYNKWGYIFLIPFIVVFFIFNLVPLATTFYYSFFENYRSGLTEIGPNFIGLENYKSLLFGEEAIWPFVKNTAIMWVMCFIPQVIVSLVLAQWFSDTRLKIKGDRFFKTVIYMPNLIMASAFAMLFYCLFETAGPINKLLITMGVIETEFDFFSSVFASRALVALMNFLMWFGNTTILLMAGIMGIDVSLYEAAEVDGTNSVQRFTKITLPLIKPILVYVVITSLIGGIQMYDVPQILTNGKGTPVNSTMTLIMRLNNYLNPSVNAGKAGALSVLLFIITGILSLVVYKVMYSKSGKEA